MESQRSGHDLRNRPAPGGAHVELQRLMEITAGRPIVLKGLEGIHQMLQSHFDVLAMLMTSGEILTSEQIWVRLSPVFWMPI